MRSYSTLDFAITNPSDLMALIHVGGRKIKKQEDSSYLELIRKLKFKMKLSYECWNNDIQLSGLVTRAISKTIDEKLALAVSKL